MITHRKLNESPSKVEDPAVLKLPLCTPKLKKITLHFPLGLEVTARNMKGVTIKDALDAIHKQFKKRVCNLLSYIFACGIIRITGIATAFMLRTQY